MSGKTKVPEAVGPNQGPYDPTNKTNASTQAATVVAPNLGSDDANPEHFEHNDPNKGPNPPAHAGPAYEDLLNMVTKQGRQIEQMQKTIAGATQLTVNKAKTKPVLPKEALQFGGESYKWRIARFTVDGEFITAEEAMFDPEIISKILAIEGQGILQKLV